MLTWNSSCERENKWLDETHYTVDSSIIPRGGAKRRKSMEPRALSNVNGTLIKADNSASASSSGRRAGADFGTMGDFMRQTPPTFAWGVFDTGEQQKIHRNPHRGRSAMLPDAKDPRHIWIRFQQVGQHRNVPCHPILSLSKIQARPTNVPPKQTRQGLFSTSSSSDDEPTQKLRFKLEAARRKSLAFKPKVGSPLIN